MSQKTNIKNSETNTEKNNSNIEYIFLKECNEIHEVNYKEGVATLKESITIDDLETNDMEYISIDGELVDYIWNKDLVLTGTGINDNHEYIYTFRKKQEDQEE